ncbi:MAG: hypothetical protein JWQ84_282 [Mucilaginibacter sp.]|jgi:hypothetical protein|nr:hypothetical protein [Mucilaginibacter sp.]MDB5015450.1 hypothetical protein [Mucilaginibacter sp.]
MDMLTVDKFKHLGTGKGVILRNPGYIETKQSEIEYAL